jgi:hypothetical protein
MTKVNEVKRSEDSSRAGNKRTRYQLKHLVWDCYLTSWTSKEKARAEISALKGMKNSMDGHPVFFRDLAGTVHKASISIVAKFPGVEYGIYSRNEFTKLVSLSESDFETLLMPEYWDIIEAEV